MDEKVRIPTAAGGAALLGGVVALGGGLWDDAWHTERGRDSFFIAPHIAIYGGITLVGLALSGWILRALVDAGTDAARRHKPLVLASLGVVVTLASAPVDNIWHVAFGRDAVIWSPPHLLGIVGTAALAIALLVELAARPDGWRGPARWIAGGSALAAFAFLTVEYDTDVPQFARVWHLPVLAVSAGFAMALVRRATTERFAATWSALAHLGFVALISAFLAADGFDTPRAPLLLLPALTLDAVGPRRPVVLRAAAFVVVLFTVYGLAGAVLWSSASYQASDLAVGAAIAWVGVSVVLQAIEGSRGSAFVRGGLATAAALAVALAFPVLALAHDPGQGPSAGVVDLTVRSADMRVEVVAQHAPGLRGGSLVARRAGRTIRSAVRDAGVRTTGALRVPDRGRWFVYLELSKDDRAVESWLPITVGDEPTAVRSRGRFAYFSEREPASTIQTVASVVLYALVLIFMGAVALVVRRTGGSLAPDPTP